MSKSTSLALLLKGAGGFEVLGWTQHCRLFFAVSVRGVQAVRLLAIRQDTEGLWCKYVRSFPLKCGQRPAFFTHMD